MMNMGLGVFSVSLNVKDLRASKVFYEALGFNVIDGDESHNFLMMSNGSSKVGLFHGMFDTNALTFNLADVRAWQDRLEVAGYAPVQRAAPGSGPAFAMWMDPDGNPILLDQVQ